MEGHFRSQLDSGSLLSSFEESLLEIDEEEDTTDFCEPFFASDPANESASAASEFPQADNFALASTTRLRQDNIGWLFERILHVRFCRHNKDLRLICQDGSVQIDPIFVMPFVHRTSFLAAILKKEEDGSKTIILPDVAIIELHQVMTLLHKGRVVSTSAKEKKAITDLLSLLGLSLDGLIIEEEVPKLPLRPIDQQQLILSIKTPLARDDLLGQDQEIKPQQKMAFFFVPSSSANSEVKSAWDLGEGDAEDVKDFFVDPNMISIANSFNKATKSRENSRLLQQDMSKLGTAPLYQDSDQAIYSCELCDDSEKYSLMAFLKHQKVHANDSPYKCSYPGCKKTFKTLSDFRAHKRVAHKPRGLKFSGHKCVKSSADYYCTKCNKRFKSVGSLKTHMISHMNLPALPPNSVKKDTIEASGVPESVAKGVFTCRICSTPHVTWTEFSKHFQKVHGSVPKILIQYKCVPCDLLFQNKQVYLDHNRKSHTPKNQVQTFPPISNESKQIYTAPKNHEQNKILLLSAPSPNFSSNGPLVKIVTPNNTSSELSPAPLTTPTSTAEKKHICPICSRGFKRSDNLKAHARTVHYGLKANNCNACGKGYRTKNELLRHQSKACPFRELQSHDFKLDFDESLLNF